MQFSWVGIVCLYKNPSEVRKLCVIPWLKLCVIPCDPTPALQYVSQAYDVVQASFTDFAQTRSYYRPTQAMANVIAVLLGTYITQLFFA